MTATNAITAEGLVKIYKSRKNEVRALDGLDLEVAEGTVLGLLGPNGAGKTTDGPDPGDAAQARRRPGHGRRLRRRPRRPTQLRSVIGLSGQYAAVDENLTGRENLWMFGRLYQLPSREAEARADELLEQFDLTDAADRVVKTYSGGMRRRLDLGSALIGRPRLLFLDEPTTGLDPRSRLGMWDVIRGLVREGTTLLLTTQYLEEADELADTIAVVDHGRSSPAAPPTSSSRRSAASGSRSSSTTAQPCPGDGAAVGAIATARSTLDEHTRRLTVPASGGGAGVLVQVVRDLDEAGIAIDDIGLRRPTLDDVFLALTGHAAEIEATTDERGTTAGRGEGRMTAAHDRRRPARRRCRQRARRRPRRRAGATSSASRASPSWRSSRSSSRSCSCCCSRSCSAARSRCPAAASYREFLMPGIFAQTIVFAAATTAIGMCDDINKGIIDRFRSLPMARSAVLTGRTFSDVVYNAGILIVLMLSGLVVGWSVHTGIVRAARRASRCCCCSPSRCPGSASGSGCRVPTVEVAQQVSFTVIFPITFLSNVFVPIGPLPTWLQPIAEWNPASTLTASLRELWGNPNPYPSGDEPRLDRARSS